MRRPHDSFLIVILLAAFWLPGCSSDGETDSETHWQSDALEACRSDSDCVGVAPVFAGCARRRVMSKMNVRRSTLPQHVLRLMKVCAAVRLGASGERASSRVRPTPSARNATRSCSAQAGSA